MNSPARMLFVTLLLAAPAHLVAQRGIDHLMTLQRTFTGKIACYDGRLKMRIVIADHRGLAIRQVRFDQFLNLFWRHV